MHRCRGRSNTVPPCGHRHYYTMEVAGDLRDVDQDAGVGDVGDADEALLDDPLALHLHAGHAGAGGKQERRWPPRARVLLLP